MNADQEKPILLIDDTCALCNKTVRFIESARSKVEFHYVSLFSDEGKKYLSQTGLPDDYDRSVVLIENEQAYIKSEAILRIVRKLKGIWPALYAFKIIPRLVSDFFYDLVAKYRHKLTGN